MKILIVSDSHGYNRGIEDVLDKCGPIDLFLHLGDVECSEYCIKDMVACDYHVIAGNNDFFSKYDREKEIYIGDYKVFMTHGHKYQVYAGLDIIREEGQRRGADIVMFGHTHMPLVDLREDVAIINPGSISYPRQEGRRPSYILMDIDKYGKSHYTINYL